MLALFQGFQAGCAALFRFGAGEFFADALHGLITGIQLFLPVITLHIQALFLIRALGIFFDAGFEPRSVFGRHGGSGQQQGGQQSGQKAFRGHSVSLCHVLPAYGMRWFLSAGLPAGTPSAVDQQTDAQQQGQGLSQRDGPEDMFVFQPEGEQAQEQGREDQTAA